jgi:polyprenyl P-hydroxybenzoate/phenylacrylic acid decarboxylase-like protein
MTVDAVARPITCWETVLSYPQVVQTLIRKSGPTPFPYLAVIVGLSGASGVVYGISFLEALKRLRIESHLIVTRDAMKTIAIETDYKLSFVESLATYNHRISDTTAPLASGSFKTDGMVVIPASMKTVSGIACGYADNLLLRAAEVTLKEERPLIIVPRETPLSIIDIQNLLTLAKAGATIVPAMPAFYNRPKTLEDIQNTLVAKVLDLLHVDHELAERWEGPRNRGPRSKNGRS